MTIYPLSTRWRKPRKRRRNRKSKASKIRKIAPAATGTPRPLTGPTQINILWWIKVVMSASEVWLLSSVRPRKNHPCSRYLISRSSTKRKKSKRENRVMIHLTLRSWRAKGRHTKFHRLPCIMSLLEVLLKKSLRSGSLLRRTLWGAGKSASSKNSWTSLECSHCWRPRWSSFQNSKISSRVCSKA